MKKAITVTILFETDALNRDEKVGNVLSIKKLTRGWGETYSFISRPAIRHYLWVTLNKAYPERWIPAEVKLAEANVIQFDIRKGNAIESPELDIFGYMSTIKGQKSVTRKAPLGITKAVSLENWYGDLGFYSNHDLVSRMKWANPNPYNKEEAWTLFKLSFTLDLEKIGTEVFAVESPSNVKKENDKIIVKFAEETLNISEIKEENNIVKGKIGQSSVELKKDKGFLFVKGTEKNETEEGLKIGKKVIPFLEKEFISEDEYWYKLDIDINTELKEEKNKWTITIKRETSIAEKMLHQGKNQGYQVENNFVEFKLKEEEKQQRIKDVLHAIYNGLYFHSSGECPGIVPLFIIAGIVKVPIPVFHSFVDVEFFKKNHRPKFKIREDLLKNAILNGWIENGKENKRLIFIEAKEPEAISKEFIEKHTYDETNWENFVNLLFDKSEEKE